jgi:ketosteroid isomerase-like protein
VIDYAAAGDLLDAYANAWRTFDGDAWIALFSDDAEYHLDPFGPPLVGHNALRALLLDAAANQRDVQVTVERHWVSGSTVLAAWHATWAGRDHPGLTRVAGFIVAEIVPDGRIGRFREWRVVAPGPGG